jgi:hypothetical protein
MEGVESSNKPIDSHTDDESHNGDGASSKASGSQKSKKAKKSSKSSGGSKHTNSTKTVIIHSGEDDIENSEDVSEARSSKSSTSKKRKLAARDDVDLFASHEPSDDEVSSTKSKKPKLTADKLTATQKIPAPPQPKAKKNSRNTAEPSAAELSSGAASGASAGQQRSTQSKLEFRAMASSGSGDQGKIGLSSSSSSSIQKGKSGGGPTATPIPQASPLPAPSLPPLAPSTEELLIMPTQPWIEPADGEAAAVSPPSQSILELTPARATRSSRGTAAAAVAPANKNLNTSNLFAESPQKRPLRSNAKRGQIGAGSESQEQQRDIGSLDIMPTQPFIDDDADSAPQKAEGPYVPPSQLMGLAEPTPVFGRRGPASAAGRRVGTQPVPPSPILITETPGMGRRRSSRLSQHDNDATIQDPAKHLHLGGPKGSTGGVGGGLLIDFNESQAATVPVLAVANAPAFIGFNLGKGGAPPSPSSKRLTANSSALAVGAAAASGSERKQRGRQQQHQHDQDDDDDTAAQQRPAPSSSAGSGLTKHDIMTLFKEEREKTLNSVQDLLDQATTRMEAAILSKLEQSFKKQDTASTKSVEELKRHLTDVVRIEVRTAIADSVTAQDVGAAQQQVKPQHVQAIVESLNGVEKMVGAWRDSLKTPAQASKK